MNYKEKRFLFTALIVLFFTFFIISMFTLSSEPEHIHSSDDVPQETSN